MVGLNALLEVSPADAIRIRRSRYLTDVFDKGRFAPMSWGCAFTRSVLADGRDSGARSGFRAGRQDIARYARLGLDRGVGA